MNSESKTYGEYFRQGQTKIPAKGKFSGFGLPELNNKPEGEPIIMCK